MKDLKELIVDTIKEYYTNVLPMYIEFLGQYARADSITERLNTPLNTSKLYIRSGRIQNMFRETSKYKDDVKITNDMISYTRTWFNSYASLHEYGASFQRVLNVTPKMRNFFYRMYKATNDKKWLNMYINRPAGTTITQSVTIRPRPFLKPAIDNSIDNLYKTINEIVNIKLNEMLKTTKI